MSQRFEWIPLWIWTWASVSMTPFDSLSHKRVQSWTFELDLQDILLSVFIVHSFFFMCSKIPFGPSIDIDIIYLPQKSVCLATSSYVQKRAIQRSTKERWKCQKLKFLNFLSKKVLAWVQKQTKFLKGIISRKSSQIFMFKTLFFATVFKTKR
jgi:hypothetical protein